MKPNYLSPHSFQKLFEKLPPETIRRIGARIDAWSQAYHLTYTNDAGKTAVITLTLRPRLIHRKKRNEFWRVLQILEGAFKKIAPLYFQDPSVAELFPFSPRESEWISIMTEPDYRPGAIASRWDSNTTFGTQDWKGGSSFFEVNGVGVGGLWYGPACADLALAEIVPELQKIDRQFRPAASHDSRLLLLGLLTRQRKVIGRTQNAIALVMERASGSNFVEFECLAKQFRTLGYSTLVTEPTDFYLKEGEVAARGKKIDILYRDTTLSELCALEEKGCDMAAFREAFRRGQVVSSLAGEFDHKSAFEVFTSPAFEKYFTPIEKNIFKRFILWTRLLREIKTTDPRGRSIDLIPFILRLRPRLVLKPNRLYGGKGIVFGGDMKPAAWKKKIESCLGKPGDWVIQEIGECRSKRFFRPDQRNPKARDLYVVSGFFSTPKGLGIVGRMSELKIVNVARRGGLTPILVIK